MPEDTKQCTKCKMIKPLSEFSKYPKGRHGTFSWCKDCANSRARELYKTDETRRIYLHKYYMKHGNLTLRKETCNLIREHHETMKDDPEHLPTEFIQTIIGIKCKNSKTTNELISNGLH